jgi:hypothetical protein
MIPDAEVLDDEDPTPEQAATGRWVMAAGGICISAASVWMAAKGDTGPAVMSGLFGALLLAYSLWRD